MPLVDRRPGALARAAAAQRLDDARARVARVDHVVDAERLGRVHRAELRAKARDQLGALRGRVCLFAGMVKLL